MTYLVNKYSPEFEVALTGKIINKLAQRITVMGTRSSGWSSTTIFGDICEYLDTSQPNINTPTTGQTLYARSSSASDTATGTGIRTMKIVYLDTAGNQQSTTVTLNGTSPVSIGTGYSFIQWMESASVGTSGTAVGNITLSSNSTGAPAVNEIFEYISIGSGKSLSARYKVPTGYSTYAIQFDAAAIGNTMDVRLRADVDSDTRALTTGVFHFQDKVFLSAGTNKNSDLKYMKFPAGSVIKVSAIPGAAPAGNKLDCSISLLTIQN